MYNGFYNTGVDVELTGGKLTGYTDAELWTVNRTEAAPIPSPPPRARSCPWTPATAALPGQGQCGLGAQRCRHGGLLLHQNVGRGGSYLEWYAEKNNWSSYGTIGSNEPLFAQQLYLVVDTQEPGQPGQPEDPSAPLKNGDQVVIYNPANLKALSSEYSGFITRAPT